MGINVRVKGATGERQVALELNAAIGMVMREMGFPESEVNKGFTQVQRRQNQSAVGGKDLEGTFDLCIEVKRQEKMLIDQWWLQTCNSTGPNEKPVLIYRRNGEGWRARMYGFVMTNNKEMCFPVILEWKDFMDWFREYVREKLSERLRIAA